MFGNPRRAYETAARATDSSRRLEAEALLKAARMLEDSAQPEAADGADVEALRHNQRLWTFLQAEIARPDHPMPSDLRSRLLNLSLFVDRRTLDLLGGADRAGTQPLIDINRNLAAGLLGDTTPTPIKS